MAPAAATVMAAAEAAGTERRARPGHDVPQLARTITPPRREAPAGGPACQADPMKKSDFHYDLPPELIAQAPLADVTPAPETPPATGATVTLKPGTVVSVDGRATVIPRLRP